MATDKERADAEAARQDKAHLNFLAKKARREQDRGSLVAMRKTLAEIEALKKKMRK